MEKINLHSLNVKILVFGLKFWKIQIWKKKMNNLNFGMFLIFKSYLSNHSSNQEREFPFRKKGNVERKMGDR